MEAADVVAFARSHGKCASGRKSAGLRAGNCGAHAADGTVEPGCEHARARSSLHRAAQAHAFCMDEISAITR